MGAMCKVFLDHIFPACRKSTMCHFDYKRNICICVCGKQSLWQIWFCSHQFVPQDRKSLEFPLCRNRKQFPCLLTLHQHLPSYCQIYNWNATVHLSNKEKIKPNSDRNHNCGLIFQKYQRTLSAKRSWRMKRAKLLYQNDQQIDTTSLQLTLWPAYGLFTLNVNVCVNFNIVLMVMQMLTYRMGLNPFSACAFASPFTQFKSWCRHLH